MKAHQTLHGYCDGHRELAASVAMDTIDARFMLALSDTSGTGGNIVSTGYLTGYPLLTGRAYALARTWPAHEMARPGCVWTHTLLIDFSDLAMLRSLNDLLALFRRPHRRDYCSYRHAVTLEVGRDPITLTTTEATWARGVLAALYAEPHEKVVAARSASIDVERVVLALWTQQWPRLRRSFCFCTFATADRSDGGCTFDLQLFPSTDFSARQRFPGAVEARSREDAGGSWLLEAARDLARPDGNGLRSFLRRVGGDAAMGRSTFPSLSRLHLSVVSFSTGEEAVHRAISLLDAELGTVSARSARKAVVEEVVEQARTLDPEMLKFVVQHLELMDAARLEMCAARIGEALWSLDPGSLESFLGKAAPYSVVLQRTVEALALNTLLTGLSRVPALACLAVRMRPELLTQPSFWSQAYNVDSDAFAVMAGSDRVRSAALTALVGSQREDLTARVIEEFGLPAVFDAIAESA